MSNSSTDDFLWVLDQISKRKLPLKELRVRDVSASFHQPDSELSDIPAAATTNPDDAFENFKQNQKKALEQDMFLSSG